MKAAVHLGTAAVGTRGLAPNVYPDMLVLCDSDVQV